MSAQECPKIQVCLPIGGKNFCAMPYNNDHDLFQISQKLSLLIQENPLPSSLIHDDSSWCPTLLFDSADLVIYSVFNFDLSGNGILTFCVTGVVLKPYQAGSHASYIIFLLETC